MSYIYSTSSPYYFDYLASCKSREEILADPELCQYLENPALKDNMELALKFKESKRGGYAEKKDFVEYLYCNGPEIDADTILYYREKCYQDPIYVQIAEIEFSDFSIVDQLRETKYGKSSNLGDCFTNPCNYLGPMSSVVGMMGDSNNFRKFPNIFSTLLKGTDEEKKNLTSVWGNIRVHLASKIAPNIRRACQMLYDSMYEHMKDFAEECKKAGITDSADIGDPLIIARADDISAATKINVINKLGDCARLWEHMRRFNPYDVNQNQKQTLPDEKIVNNKSTNGAPIDKVKPPSVFSFLPEQKLKEVAATGNKEAQWQLELQNFPVLITEDDYHKLVDTNIPWEERLEYGRNLLYNANDIKRKKFFSAVEEYKKKYSNNKVALQALDKKYNEEAQLDQQVRDIIDFLSDLANQPVDVKPTDDVEIIDFNQEMLQKFPEGTEVTDMGAWLPDGRFIPRSQFDAYFNQQLENERGKALEQASITQKVNSINKADSRFPEGSYEDANGVYLPNDVYLRKEDYEKYLNGQMPKEYYENNNQ